MRCLDLALCPLLLAAAPPDPQALADRIDARIDAALIAAKVTPAPRAGDAEFLRRAHLDITGRIPPRTTCTPSSPTPTRRSGRR